MRIQGILMAMVDGAFWSLSVNFNKALTERSAAAFLTTLNGVTFRKACLSVGRNQKKLALRSSC